MPFPIPEGMRKTQVHILNKINSSLGNWWRTWNSADLVRRKDERDNWYFYVLSCVVENSLIILITIALDKGRKMSYRFFTNRFEMVVHQWRNKIILWEQGYFHLWRRTESIEKKKIFSLSMVFPVLSQGVIMILFRNILTTL